MDDPEIAKIHYRAATLCQRFNSLPITESEERDKVLRQIFNLHVGDNFLTNYNVTILDMAPVTIGNNTWLGPGVGVFAVAHPMEAAGRVDRLGIAKPITIGDNVWVGGNATILMGVTIGNNVIIGAGSVVTHDIPDNAVAVGNPAKVIRYVENKR